jgi:hypothetical protein
LRAQWSGVSGAGSCAQRQLLVGSSPAPLTPLAKPRSVRGSDGPWLLEVFTISTDVPPPVLFNAHKHHAGFLRERVRRAVTDGPDGLRALAAELVVVGAKLMDLYHGPFSPAEIAAKVMTALAKSGHGAPAAFRAWVDAAGGYRTVEFPEDTSRWVLRAGDEDDRFVHVHPARYSPFTIRVRANVLTTAVMALAYTGLHGGDPLSRPVVNAVRRDYLGLAPVGRDPSGDEGIGSVIELLR